MIGNLHAVRFVSTLSGETKTRSLSTILYTMKDSDLYWLAGLLEGEGSFLAGPPSSPNKTRISVSMCDLDVIERVADLFGVSYIYTRTDDRPNHSDTYQVAVSGSNARSLMSTLRPLMGERRQGQIDAALDSYDPHLWAKSRSKYSIEQVTEALEHIRDGHKLIDISRKLELPYQFIRDLNTGRTWKSLADEIL